MGSSDVVDNHGNWAVLLSQTCHRRQPLLQRYSCLEIICSEGNRSVLVADFRLSVHCQTRRIRRLSAIVGGSVLAGYITFFAPLIIFLLVRVTILTCSTCYQWE